VLKNLHAKYSEGIPRIVHFTSPFLPEEFESDNRKFLPPGFQFRFYNDSQLEHSMKLISQRLEEEGIYNASV